MLQVVFFIISIAKYLQAIDYSNALHETEILNRKYKELANKDLLTGLGNRRQLEKDLPELLNKDLFVIMMDIDKFKRFNDSFGHEFGDKILNVMGNTILNNIHSPYCYRYGGDEMLVIIEGTTEEDFIESIEKCSNEFTSIFKNEYSLNLKYSQGWIQGRASSLPEIKALISDADSLLYKNKKNH